VENNQNNLRVATTIIVLVLLIVIVAVIPKQKQQAVTINRVSSDNLELVAKDSNLIQNISSFKDIPQKKEKDKPIKLTLKEVREAAAITHLIVKVDKKISASFKANIVILTKPNVPFGMLLNNNELREYGMNLVKFKDDGSVWEERYYPVLFLDCIPELKSLGIVKIESDRSREELIGDEPKLISMDNDNLWGIIKPNVVRY